MLLAGEARCSYGLALRWGRIRAPLPAPEVCAWCLGVVGAWGGIALEEFEERADRETLLQLVAHFGAGVDRVVVPAADSASCDVPASVRSATIRCAARSVIPTWSATSRVVCPDRGRCRAELACGWSRTSRACHQCLTYASFIVLYVSSDFSRCIIDALKLSSLADRSPIRPQQERRNDEHRRRRLSSDGHCG